MGQIGLRGVYIYALTKRQCTSVDLSLRLLNYGPVLYLNLRGIKRWQVDEEHFIKLIWILLHRLVYMCVSFKIVKKVTKKKKTLGQSIESVCVGGGGGGLTYVPIHVYETSVTDTKLISFQFYIKIYLHECVLIQYKRKEWNWTPELRSLILCLLKRFGNAVVLPAPTFLCHLCNLINKSPFLWLPKRRHNDTPLLTNSFCITFESK